MNDEPLFEAVLSPYRSLGRIGLVVLMTITSVITAIHMTVFAKIGAWPVFGFFGLDLALLFGAFWLSYRSGRAREFIRMSRLDLNIRKVTPSGRAVDHQFNPFWTRFTISRHDEIGITGMQVSSRGRQTEIGSFLNPDDKESFASAFQRALATVKKR
ncbi:DUF2244 domain-containing protein [Hoeflea sp. YIM 152468]|uniref:DUF2244 domain-containing protein n=1 Tax=Hoeflea sp. YIM 152468 TaxID=3031759 RepID=UPI0023DA6522|nr:DUF2244 domain-containing protein [Hoeflea sp. YIM 152468]MDF1608388.1 DUF2244 domain-containing protein [Hoeflea sp. YIM 152468]